MGEAFFIHYTYVACMSMAHTDQPLGMQVDIFEQPAPHPNTLSGNTDGYRVV